MVKSGLSHIPSSERLKPKILDSPTLSSLERLNSNHLAGREGLGRIFRMLYNTYRLIPKAGGGNPRPSPSPPFDAPSETHYSHPAPSFAFFLRAKRSIFELQNNYQQSSKRLQNNVTVALQRSHHGKERSALCTGAKPWGTGDEVS
jgi:hypothetical protein